MSKQTKKENSYKLKSFIYGSIIILIVFILIIFIKKKNQNENTFGR
jgi:hypothetical protein